MQDPSGGAAEEALSRVLQRWGDQLSGSKGRSELHNPLSMGEALPLLPLSRSLFAGAQPSDFSRRCSCSRECCSMHEPCACLLTSLGPPTSLPAPCNASRCRTGDQNMPTPPPSCSVRSCVRLGTTDPRRTGNEGSSLQVGSCVQVSRC